MRGTDWHRAATLLGLAIRSVVLDLSGALGCASASFAIPGPTMAVDASERPRNLYELLCLKAVGGGQARLAA
jgi:hypothetical protein